MEAKKNKRTLKKRIRKSIILSTIITTLIFSGIIYYLATELLGVISNYTADYLGSKIAIEMNSDDFLKKYDLKSLEYFGPAIKGYNEWVGSINRTVNFRPSAPPQKSNPKLSLSIVRNMLKLNTIAYVEIVLNEKQIYTNAPDASGFSSNGFINKIYNRYSTISDFELLDQNASRIVGKVYSRVNPRLLAIIFFTIIVLICSASFIVFMFAILFSRFAVYPIIGPIMQLDKKMQAIAEEDFETTLNTHIVLKRPPREIQSIADSTNRIMQKLKYYNEQFKFQNSTLENQNSELESQNIELTESRRQIEEAQEKLFMREKSVRTLLDNAGQGFLSFGRDLLVDKEHSSECAKIFGGDITGKYLPDLISCSDKEQKTFLENVLKKIFLEKASTLKQIYITLLPEEISINNKVIHIDYKTIGDIDDDKDDDIMLIITDVTHNKYLESQIEQERNILKMVVKTVVNYNDFINNLNDYYNFCENGIEEIFSTNNNLEDIIYSFSREIHTFKGNFSQMCLVNVVKYLHNIESVIAEIRKSTGSITIDDFRQYLIECKLKNLVDEDLSSLKGILGQDYFRRDEVVIVDCRKLLQIEKKMLEILSPAECRTLLPDLKKLRYKTFKEFVSNYSDYVQRLSLNLGKLVNPLTIEGGDFQVDRDKYKYFIKSLVHIFRNIMDHAIESPEERIEAGKTETGNIICHSEIIDDENLYLLIADDGKGIDLDILRNKAAEKGFYTKDEANNLSKEEVLNLIFMEGFSTKDEITQLSGRGVGLAAVKNEVAKLGGSIKVRTEKGIGTEFEFIIPYEQLNKTPEITISSIVKPLINKARCIMNDEIAITSELPNAILIKQVEKLQLLKYTVFVGIKGIVNGKILISVDEALAKLITHKFVLQSVSSEEEDALIEDALAEYSNVIVGNSFKLIPQLEDLLIMEVPITIYSECASFNCPASMLWTAEFAIGPGKMRLGFSSVDNIIE